MNIEINHRDSFTREDCIINKSNEKATSPNGFLYMDMDVFLEDEKSLDEAEVKEEEEETEENSSLESNENQFKGGLPSDVIENAENDSIVGCNSANDCEGGEKKITELNLLQKKNHSKEKRYRLRSRTCQRKVDHSNGFQLENYKLTKKKETKKSKNSMKGSRSISLKCSTCKKNISPYQLTDNSSQSNGMQGKHDEFQNQTCKKCSFRKFNSDEVLYDCSRCSQTFESKERLEFYAFSDECTNSNEYTCDICKEAFAKMSTLRRHILSHLNDSQPQFDNSQVEMRINDGENELHLCHLCNKSFHQLKIHLRRQHGIVFKCSKCNKSFESEEKLACHSRGSKCGQTCRYDSSHRKKQVRNHLPEVEEGEEIVRKPLEKSRYECDECGHKFIKLVKLKIHILNVHHGIDHRCGKCNGNFPSREELEAHERKETCKRKRGGGEEEDPSTCKICGKAFAKREYLKKHQYMHANVLFKCKYCYCAFMKEKSYSRHVEKMNCSKSARKIKMAEFNYRKCRICQIEYESEESLMEHFRESHSGQEPHQCFCCDACLPTFRDLQAHIHHHNVKKYTCNMCGKPYTSQEGFRKHRLKHKGAEFKCRFCDSEFLNESRFKFHEKTCKKNPETGFESVKQAKKKDEKPKPSRQLHWESRIIMKHLRGDPKSVGRGDTAAVAKENSLALAFFEEPENDVTDQRGWFDNYYKTEEDDIAFGLGKVENEKTKQDCELDDCAGEGVDEKKKSQEATETAEDVHQNGAAAAAAADSSESSDQSESSLSEEESVEEDELPIDYNPKKCRLCAITFDQEYELLHHFIRSHPKEQAHECPECEVRCPLFAQLKEHMKTHGIGMGIHNCDNCSKKFRSEKKMKSHNVRCKGANAAEEKDGKSFLRSRGERCKRCGKMFHTKFGYKKHKQLCKVKKKKEGKSTKARNDTRSGDENVGLPGMNTKIAPQPNGLASSEEEKEKETNAIKEAAKEKKGEVRDAYAGDPPLDSFPCRLCEKKFQYERGIVMHFKSTHPGHKPLVCHVCNMHLADKLKEHLKTHGIGEEFICELCGKRFNQKFLSKIHEMWHQGIEYKCANCKQKFLNKEKMDKHVGENRCSNRQSLMRLPCGICGKSYRSKFGLSKHHITHTPKELRPVKNRMNCEYCGKWFENNNGLQRHRRIHTGERPFCCRFCPKAFAQEGNCKAHERIHTGESKPRKKKAPEQEPLQPPSNPPRVLSLQQILPPVPLSAQNDVTQILFPPSGSTAAPDSISYPGHISLYVYETSDDSPAGIVH